MFRFFKYIVLFILGYKVIKMLFAEEKPSGRVAPNPPKDNINVNNPPQHASNGHSKFDGAELIDYEEVK